MSSKNHIQQALYEFVNESDVRTGFEKLLGVMGYSSDRTIDLGSVKEYLSHDQVKTNFTDKQIQKMLELFRSLAIVFQFSESDIRKQYELSWNQRPEPDFGRAKSFLFIAVELVEYKNYSRTLLAELTRIINRPFKMPVIVLFRHHKSLTLAAVHRRVHKIDSTRDVLEKSNAN